MRILKDIIDKENPDKGIQDWGGECYDVGFENGFNKCLNQSRYVDLNEVYIKYDSFKYRVNTRYAVSRFTSISNKFKRNFVMFEDYLRLYISINQKVEDYINHGKRTK
jgi:hypothetical protein